MLSMFWLDSVFILRAIVHFINKYTLIEKDELLWELRIIF